MANPAQFVPKWARDTADAGRYRALGDMPNVGAEPALAPRLPTRLLPFKGRNSISSMTLSDTVWCTQRILTFVSYEVVYGPQPEFVDLRRVSDEILKLARLDIEPFEEGSFVIPGTLSDEPVNVMNVEYSSEQVLARFSEVMDAIATNQKAHPVSLGLLQSIADLGKITRREADIEYYPTWGLQRQRAQDRKILVNNGFIEMASQAKAVRENPDMRPDTLEGTLIALDVQNGTLGLRTPERVTVNGNFGELSQQRLIEAFNKRVKLYGIVTYRARRPRHIRTYSVELLED